MTKGFHSEKKLMVVSTLCFVCHAFLIVLPCVLSVRWVVSGGRRLVAESFTSCSWSSPRWCVTCSAGCRTVSSPWWPPSAGRESSAPSPALSRRSSPRAAPSLTPSSTSSWTNRWDAPVVRCQLVDSQTDAHKETHLFWSQDFNFIYQYAIYYFNIIIYN